MQEKDLVNKQEQDSVSKVDRNKIYFLIVVIAALLGINAYLYFKNKQESSRFVTVSTEKDRLNLEVEKIEVELDKVNALNVNLSEKLQKEQQLARDKIAELKLALQKGRLTQGELDKAKKQINDLKEFVKNYSDQIGRLEKENYYLKSERDSLKNTADVVTQRAEELEKQNENLNAKVKIGEILKTSNIDVEAYQVKSNGKNVPVTKASATNRLLVSFNIAANSLAEKNYKRIYLRVFDPAGNLIANDTDFFEANGQQMQFSSMIQISYNNDDTVYRIEWTNPKAFMKGAYTLILYCDGFEMGKSQIQLK